MHGKYPLQVSVKYRMIQNDGLNFVHLYFLTYTWYVNDLHKIWNRKSHIFKYHRRALAYLTAMQQHQLRAKWLLCSTRCFYAYHRRTWDEFKTGLSVAHSSQPIEWAENLGYRNQLSGVCWAAVYCSIEYIFLNHPVLYGIKHVFGRRSHWTFLDSVPGNVYIVTREAFVLPLLQLKSNKYYIFWECVCSLMCPAAMRTHHVVICGLPGSTVFFHIIA